eukprot:Blabericola_migrator_1__1729@NODE_1465_length_4501_cov_60_448805_g965_i0_p1_GENE_NODE_1465_length_4501_cov_60_448805_g965_i0NODE_1465_length_4501_cov_60_448805_g965_i0_p1_ORF_typecomplete_len949_score104_13L27/PF02828_16/1_7e04L27/PF02828_16/39L27/PF02828_16/59_NODE_1465_length_4501_cov_60_448805_g965_i03353181
MKDGEWFSKFCDRNFRILPPCGRPLWIERSCDAVRSLTFSETMLLPNLNRMMGSVIDIRQALAESLSDASPMRQIALKIIQNNIDQIRCAVTKANPWDENPMNIRLGILDVLEQCEILCACTPHDSWHERVKAISGCLETSSSPGLWRTMRQLLTEADSVVATRCFSVVELKTLARVQALATISEAYDDDYYAALCVAQCAKLRARHTKATETHEPTQRVDTSLQLATRAISVQNSLQPTSRTDCSELGEMSLPKSDPHKPDKEQNALQRPCSPLCEASASEHSKVSQVNKASERLHTSLVHRQLSFEEFQLPPSTLLHREDRRKTDGNPRESHSSYEGPQSGLQLPVQDAPTLVEKWSLLGAKPKEIQPVESALMSTLTRQTSQEVPKTEGTGKSQRQSVVLSSVTGSATVKSDLLPEGGAYVEAPSATNQTSEMSLLTSVEQKATALIDILREQRSDVHRRKTADIIPHMHALLQAHIELIRAPATLLNARSLGVLSEIRSSLLAVRRKAGRTLDQRCKGCLNRIIFVTSRLWHLALLANPRTTQHNAFNLDEIAKLSDLTWTSLAAFVAFETYASLLKEASVKAPLDDFVTFISSASRPFDLPTAKLCLLILSYLDQGNVKLVAQRAQKMLSKLILNLRRTIFDGSITEMQIHDFPGLIEFCSAYFEADACQDFDWRASLKLNEIAAQDVQLPLLGKLIGYGNFSVRYLNHFSRRDSRTTRVLKTMYAEQVDSLNNLCAHMLSLKSPERVFDDTKVLAALERTSAFVEACLRECEVDGVRAHEYESQILRGTMCHLQWFLLLSAHLKVTPPIALRKTYDNVTKAWILKSLWSHEKTACLEQRERACISAKILSALANVTSDDVLVTCVQAFLDQSIPSRLVKGLFNKVFGNGMNTGGSRKPQEYAEALRLLTVHCRAEMYQNEMPSAGRDLYSEVVERARRVAQK